MNKPPPIPVTGPPPPSPPGPTAPTRSQRQMQVLLLRIGMVAIVAASVALVWWSTSKRLVPASRQLKEQAVAMARLANEVQQLEMNWNTNEAQRVEAEFRQTQARLFTNDSAMLDWRQDTERRAEGLGFEPVSELNTNQAPVVAAKARKLARVPLTLHLRPLEFMGTTNTPYRRLLQLARSLQEVPKNVDLLDVSISGNTNSVREAHVLLQGWRPQ